MEGNIPNEFVDEVRNRFDIVELVSEYVQLKKSGRNYFGLCPFHGEKTPSFSVSPDKQIFHCFGCGEGGNVFSFLMKLEGTTFPEAVRELAKRVGLSLPQSVSTPAAQQKQRAKDRLQETVDWAQKLYRHYLSRPEGIAALAYLKKRGLSMEIINNFGLGFAPDSWDTVKQFLRKKGYNEREQIEAGLLTDNERRTYDRFRNRIIFPICNQRGDIIAFGGRSLGDGMPKYLNSSETPLFDKSKNLYALHLAREAIRQKKQAIIFEGYMDVIAAHQAGITNSVASLGTSLTEAQARLLRNQAEEVVIVYDADAAGQAATWRGMQILRQAGCLVKVGRLPEGLDPDDYIRKYGGSSFLRNVIDNALLLVDYQLESLTEKFDLEKDDDRIRLFEKIGDVLVSVENAMEREDYINKVSGMLRIPVASIREELAKKRQPVTQRGPVSATPVTATKLSAVEIAPLQLLALWSRFPGLAAPSVSELSEDDFPTELHFFLEDIRNDDRMFSASRLLDMLPEGKHRQILSRLLIEEEYNEKVAKKAIDDCIRLLKSVRIARQRQELEAQMAKLDPAVSKGEIMELSKKWLELRKYEEEMNHPREGGKGVG